MACRLAGATLLSDPMLEYFQLDPKEHISVKFYFEFERFHSRKDPWKWRLRPFLSSRPQCVNRRIRKERSFNLPSIMILKCLWPQSHSCLFLLMNKACCFLYSNMTTLISVCISTHGGRGKMAAIFQTTFSNAFYWMKMYEFRLRFHWSLSLRAQLTIFQHWFS